MNNKTNTSTITKNALCVAVLTISSYLVLPLPFTPIVLGLQTVAVNLIGLIFSPKHAAYTLFVYILMGLIGLPVFSGGTAGAGKLFGPTGGFYFGFLFAVIAIASLKGKTNDKFRYMLITIAVGIPIQHFFAVLFMCFYNDFNVWAAFLSVSAPFIFGDVLKCVIAAIIAVPLNKILKK